MKWPFLLQYFSCHCKNFGRARFFLYFREGHIFCPWQIISSGRAMVWPCCIFSLHVIASSDSSKKLELLHCSLDGSILSCSSEGSDYYETRLKDQISNSSTCIITQKHPLLLSISKTNLLTHSFLSFRLSSYGQYVIMLTTMFATLIKVCTEMMICKVRRWLKLPGNILSL